MKHWMLLVGLLLGGAAMPAASASMAMQQPRYRSAQDSIRQAQQAEKMRLADSVKQVADSLAMLYIGLPDPNRPNAFADSLRERVIVQNGDFMTWLAFANQVGQSIETDAKRPSREPWVLVAIGLLLLFLGLVRVAFPNQVLSIIQAFYNDRLLLQVNKEDTLYSSWPFVFLYILFGFAVGLFIYLCNAHYAVGYSGIERFLGISLFVMLMFILKIIATRLLGFIFDLQRVVREYVSILYLSYFNAALVFLPIILVLSLVPRTYVVWVVPAALIIVFCLFVFRFTKTARNLLTNYPFSKFYLFTYLCCLEIAPILILVKVLGN
ncbi:DUF4271 domain-containing protein [Parapedobacter sp. 10938]|uniref:DUF4271 domain-containing protein n=1 Tax=Parapedobacter flavus TaxID=3110225 RepID=UPI002DBCE21C|nr:DUF4271 domain-containing protein [Parapedobacter sp. 10938]MEC3880814.1 DUF4271 domain-containing protein [Parapedobacter sp. 10938]